MADYPSTAEKSFTLNDSMRHLVLSGIPWRIPRSLRRLVNDTITSYNVLLRYQILAALPKSKARRALDSVGRATGHRLSISG